MTEQVPTMVEGWADEHKGKLIRYVGARHVDHYYREGIGDSTLRLKGICHRSTSVPRDEKVSAQPEGIPCHSCEAILRREATKSKRSRVHKSKRDGWQSIVVKLLGSKCWTCNQMANVQIDHIIPISQGGRHEPDNLQLLCRSCHREKTYLHDRNLRKYEERTIPPNLLRLVKALFESRSDPASPVYGGGGYTRELAAYLHISVIQASKIVSLLSAKGIGKIEKDGHRVIIQFDLAKLRRIALLCPTTLRKGAPWAEYELGIMRNIFPLEGVAGISKLLPHRTASAIVGKAHKMSLRQVNSNSKLWRPFELGRLRIAYTQGGIDKAMNGVPDRSPLGARVKALQIGARWTAKAWRDIAMDEGRI